MKAITTSSKATHERNKRLNSIAAQLEKVNQDIKELNKKYDYENKNY